MELIEKIGARKQGLAIISWGLFLCPYCKEAVEKQLGNGKQAKSCGCMKSVKTISKHGDSKRGTYYALYRVWLDMKARCLNPDNKAYLRYGGRGIKICELWSDYLEFKKFALANGWKKGLQIDRKNNDGNYEPNNCRFVTPLENNRNRSSIILSMEKAKLIRSLFLTKLYSQCLLARMFSVSQFAIWRVVHNKIWKENKSLGEET